MEICTTNRTIMKDERKAFVVLCIALGLIIVYFALRHNPKPRQKRISYPESYYLEQESLSELTNEMIQRYE